MAVNVNSVYQTVLYIINKEQRGYITPAEFNSLATQVQDEIFNSYFPDGNQVNRLNQSNNQNDTEFFNMFKDIAYKLYPFERVVDFLYDSSTLGWGSILNIRQLGEVISTYTSQPQYDSITELVSKKDYEKIIRSKLTQPSKQSPICTVTQVNSLNASLQVPIGDLLIQVYPNPNLLNINCLVSPVAPQWGFTVGPQGQYLFNGGTSVNFQLIEGERSNIIINILKYCGIIINDPTIIQAAEQESRAAEANLKS
tara:strand:- start:139 stop:900 length:762 start_codon:yes stop_codon:yes gene_type:complete